MIHVLNAFCEPDDAVLRRMFEARKSVFIDLLKWDIPALDGRFEIDQFDDEHAIYIILTDTVGQHLASARLLPTIRPHILDSIFPFLCEAPPPRDEHIFEITRFCLDRSLKAVERRRVRNRLVDALVRYALAHRVTAFTGVAELGWYQQILAFGWRCLPLGFPVEYDGTLLAALTIEIDGGTLSRLSAAGIVSELPEHMPPHAEAA